MAKELPLPSFYNPANAENWDYRPDQLAIFKDADAWRRRHAIKPAASSKLNLHLLLIDVQKDFCYPKGTLYVGGRSGNGAIEDSKRIAEFIYRNLSAITDITTTLDTHFAFQIFFASFFLNKDGGAVDPFRFVTTADILNGDIRPNPAIAHALCNGNYTWLQKQAQFYCEELEKANKYKLYLWPYHCILGDAGHALVGTVHEAKLFHSFVRGSLGSSEVKGGNPFTENYSVLRPEVLMRHDGKPLDQKNTRFIKTLLEADAVVIAGQAASHCVKSSIDDLLSEIVAQDSSLAKKVYVVTDCMSSVVVPDGKGGISIDFTSEAEEAYKRFADAGMNLVKSTDPINTWPGLAAA